MRISDWSSDVCSSDLEEYPRHARDAEQPLRQGRARRRGGIGEIGRPLAHDVAPRQELQRGRVGGLLDLDEHGRASPSRPRRGAEPSGAKYQGWPEHGPPPWSDQPQILRSEEHTSELQSLMRISY